MYFESVEKGGDFFEDDLEHCSNSYLLNSFIVNGSYTMELLAYLNILRKLFPEEFKYRSGVDIFSSSDGNGEYKVKKVYNGKTLVLEDLGDYDPTKPPEPDRKIVYDKKGDGHSMWEWKSNTSTNFTSNIKLTDVLSQTVQSAMHFALRIELPGDNECIADPFVNNGKSKQNVSVAELVSVCKKIYDEDLMAPYKEFIRDHYDLIDKLDGDTLNVNFTNHIKSMCHENVLCDPNNFDRIISTINQLSLHIVVGLIIAMRKSCHKTLLKMISKTMFSMNLNFAMMMITYQLCMNDIQDLRNISNQYEGYIKKNNGIPENFLIMRQANCSFDTFLPAKLIDKYNFILFQNIVYFQRKYNISEGQELLWSLQFPACSNEILIHDPADTKDKPQSSNNITFPNDNSCLAFTDKKFKEIIDRIIQNIVPLVRNHLQKILENKKVLTDKIKTNIPLSQQEWVSLDISKEIDSINNTIMTLNSDIVNSIITPQVTSYGQTCFQKIQNLTNDVIFNKIDSIIAGYYPDKYLMEFIDNLDVVNNKKVVNTKFLYESAGRAIIDVDRDKNIAGYCMLNEALSRQASMDEGTLLEGRMFFDIEDIPVDDDGDGNPKHNHCFNDIDIFVDELINALFGKDEEVVKKIKSGVVITSNAASLHGYSYHVYLPAKCVFANLQESLRNLANEALKQTGTRKGVFNYCDPFVYSNKYINIRMMYYGKGILEYKPRRKNTSKSMADSKFIKSFDIVKKIIDAVGNERLNEIKNLDEELQSSFLTVTTDFISKALDKYMNDNKIKCIYVLNAGNNYHVFYRLGQDIINSSDNLLQVIKNGIKQSMICNTKDLDGNDLIEWTPEMMNINFNAKYNKNPIYNIKLSQAECDKLNENVLKSSETGKFKERLWTTNDYKYIVDEESEVKVRAG